MRRPEFLARATGAVAAVVAVAAVSGTAAAQEGGGGEVELHSLGVPILAHWVGIAAIFGIIVSLVFTFYVLKYGESAHSSSPNRK
jgi:hypothetical protein